MKNTKIKYHYFILIIMIILLGNLKAIFFHAGRQEQEILVTTQEISSTILEVTTIPEIIETTSLVAETTVKKSQVEKKKKGNFKSYTDYKCISKKSPQWKIQEQAYTDENGLRKIEEYYLVALGSYYGTELGTKYLVTLTSGNQFKIILCDCKSNKHTDELNQVCLVNGSILEFYVETNKLSKEVRNAGSIGVLPQFAGEVESIEKIV